MLINYLLSIGTVGVFKQINQLLSLFGCQSEFPHPVFAPDWATRKLETGQSNMRRSKQQYSIPSSGRAKLMIIVAKCHPSGTRKHLPENWCIPFSSFPFLPLLLKTFSSLKAPLVKISIFILFLLREKMKPVRVMQPCPSRDLNSWKFRPRLKLSMKRVSLTEIGYKKTLHWFRI